MYATEHELEKPRRAGILYSMLTEELKTAVDTLSEQERHELSCYLTKLELQNELQNNPDYWKTIRQRTNSDRQANWIQADQLTESQ